MGRILARENALVSATEVRPVARTARRVRVERYNRTAIMKYIEEVLAETYSLCEREGYSWKNIRREIRFPVANAYVTTTQLATEGKAVGTVVVGSMMFMVMLLDEAPAVPATIPPKEELECKIEKPECSL
jgi:hypothetical protein